MEKISITQQNLLQVVLLDILSGIAIYCIPAISHMVTYPLYYFDPMRCIILLGFLRYRNKWNSAFLALTLPLISYFISGHPIIFKSLIISAELLINVFLLSYFLKKEMNSFFAVCGSIITSKIAYYLLKLLAIKLSFVHTNVVDTDLIFQIAVCVVIAFIWTLIENRNNE